VSPSPWAVGEIERSERRIDADERTAGELEIVLDVRGGVCQALPASNMPPT